MKLRQKSKIFGETDTSENKTLEEEGGSSTLCIFFLYIFRFIKILFDVKERERERERERE